VVPPEPRRCLERNRSINRDLLDLFPEPEHHRIIATVDLVFLCPGAPPPRFFFPSGCPVLPRPRQRPRSTRGTSLSLLPLLYPSISLCTLGIERSVLTLLADELKNRFS
jgi:hypothetical protein